MQVWAIRAGLADSLVSKSLLFFLLSSLHRYLEVLGGFSSSIVAPLLISAQQKKHAIRVIIVAAACFLAVLQQLHLLSLARWLKGLVRQDVERTASEAVGRELEWSQ